MESAKKDVAEYGNDKGDEEIRGKSLKRPLPLWWEDLWEVRPTWICSSISLRAYPIPCGL